MNTSRMALVLAGFLTAGLVVVLPVPASSQSPTSQPQSQGEALNEAKQLMQQVIQLYQQGKYTQAIPLAQRALAIREKALRDGVYWGLGHTTTLVVAGAFILLGRITFLTSGYFEAAVGLMLVIMGISRLLDQRRPAAKVRPGATPSRAAYAVGLLHGLAGSGALVLLHSATTARHFAHECDRLGLARGAIALAALGPRIAAAAGSGWGAVHTAARPDEAALLEMVFDLCQNASLTPVFPPKQP